MTTDDPVRRALAAVAEADASRHAPPHLERAVLDALDQQMDRGYLQRWMGPTWSYRHTVAAIALVVTVSTAMYFGVVDDVFDRRSGTTERASHTSLERQSVQAEVDAVLAMHREGDIAQRVIVRLPRAMLPMLGVPIINPDAPGTVNLEVTLGQDGLAHTIRIVP